MDRKQDESFVRRLVFSYSIVLVIILILGVSLYNIYIRNLSFEIRNQNKLILMNTIQDMNNNFATMDPLQSRWHQILILRIWPTCQIIPIRISINWL